MIQKGPLRGRFGGKYRDSDVRIIFCTIAFGMGINCQNLTRVFHFGQSQDIDDYMQESGRGGRGGEMCTAVLVKYCGCTRLPTSQRIKEYLKNKTQCRRELLLVPFGRKPATRMLAHTCCDVCFSSVWFISAFHFSKYNNLQQNMTGYKDNRFT